MKLDNLREDIGGRLLEVAIEGRGDIRFGRSVLLADIIISSILRYRWGNYCVKHYRVAIAKADLTAPGREKSRADPRKTQKDVHRQTDANAS